MSEISLSCHWIVNKISEIYTSEMNDMFVKALLPLLFRLN